MTKNRIIKNISLIAAILFISIPACLAYSDLVDIYKIAEKNDVIIRQQQALFEATKKDKPIERSALLPQIDLSARRGITRIEHTRSPLLVRYKEYDLLLNQVLFDWEKWHRYLRTTPLITIAEKTWYQENQNLILRVSQAYLDILLAEDIVEFTEKEYQAIYELYKESKLRFEVGDIARSDIDQVQADLDAITSDLLAARNDLANSKERLQEITNQKVPDLARLKNNLKMPSLKPTTIKEWTDIALQNNLSLLSAQANKKVADHNISIAEAGYMPTAQLSAKLRGSSLGRIINNVTRPQRQFVNTFRVAVDIRSPNLNPYGTIAENNKARYDYHVADQGYIEQYRRTEKLVEQYYREVLASQKQISALDQSVKAAQSALDATQESFEVGNRAYVFVLNRISDLYSAKRDQRQAVYRYIMALLNLQDTAGRLSPKDLVAVNKMLNKYPKLEKTKQSKKA